MAGILVATHGGASSDAAVRIGAALAQRRGVALHALTVLAPIPVTDFGVGATYVPSEEEEAAAQAVMLAAATEQVRRLGVTGCAPTLRVGPVVGEIATAARLAEADLIVVGLGSHLLLDRALGGETALGLAQMANTPVLAVRADATAIPRVAVVAIDFSATSIRAAETVANWLVAGDTIHLVHVASDASGAAGGVSATAARLRDTAAQLPLAPGVHSLVAERAGAPARALLAYQREVQGDVIALGSHGYGLWKRLTLGSVASKIIRVTATSVLVAPIGCVIAKAEHGDAGRV